MAALTANTVLLHRYKLIAPIADRGLGETWEGLDARLEGRRVLVKVLERCEDGARKKALARLQTLRMFRHPGALAVTDHGVHDGQPFIVHDLPLVGSLATLIDRYRAGEIALSLEKIAALVARIAQVVNAGHDEPGALVHGALRPRAVLVPDDLDTGQMVLVDVGLRDLGRDPDAPKDSAAAARCLAPEQFEGEPMVPRTDTFALGLLVLEILRAPPSGATPASPRYLGRPEVPDGVWDALLLATRLPIVERPSIEAFADLLAPTWIAPPVVAPVSIPGPSPMVTVASPAAVPVESVAAPLVAAAPVFDAAPRYEPQSAIPYGGLLGAMPSLAMPSLAMPPIASAPALAMPSLAMPPIASAPVLAMPALAHPAAFEAIELGERTVAFEEVPDLAGYAVPSDPLGATRTVSPRVQSAPVEFVEERTVMTFAVRMQAVDDMLSTVDRALPPELDAVAASFRAQMASSRRRDEPVRKPLLVSAPRRPEAPTPAAPVAPVAPAREPPYAIIGSVLAVIIVAALAVILTHR